MSWEETRGGVVETARRTAHSDDAKERTDESHHAARTLRTRARWLVPALLGGLVVLLLGGGATAAWVAARDDRPTSTASVADPPPSGGDKAAGPAVDASTGLPLEPTDQDVTYSGVVRCEEPGAFLISQCPSVFPETLTCPGGVCTISFFVGPSLADRGPNPDATVVTFRAGDPTVQFQGTDKSERCPGRLSIDGSRQPDGGYEIRTVNGKRAGEADGSCSKPSDSVFTITLAPPP